VCTRDAEHADDGIADELLHRPPVPLESTPHLVEIREHDLPHRLGVYALAESRRAGQVAEQDGGQLAPFLGRRREGRPAHAAMDEPVGTLGAAA
jgi:hypothetical protein